MYLGLAYCQRHLKTYCIFLRKTLFDALFSIFGALKVFRLFPNITVGSTLKPVAWIEPRYLFHVRLFHHSASRYFVARICLIHRFVPLRPVTMGLIIWVLKIALTILNTVFAVSTPANSIPCRADCFQITSARNLESPTVKTQYTENRIQYDTERFNFSLYRRSPIKPGHIFDSWTSLSSPHKRFASPCVDAAFEKLLWRKGRIIFSLYPYWWSCTAIRTLKKISSGKRNC